MKILVAWVIPLLCFGAGVAVALLWRPSAPPYALVEQLRGEQDADGTHTERVRQRFYRLYKEHPRSAMYAYLWARCVDDPAKQLELAQQGIAADPRFSWNYNMAARALARLNRVPEAYDQARRGTAIDPGNLELAEKERALKAMIDRKLPEEAIPADGPAQRYVGLFRGGVRSPDASDVQAIEKVHQPDDAGPAADAVRGFVVCANPYADSCLRGYVPRGTRFKNAWPGIPVDVGAIHDHDVVDVHGTVVTNSRGERLLVADSVTVERP